jgi:predicted tellurium resistance membrane protein TerC
MGGDRLRTVSSDDRRDGAEEVNMLDLLVDPHAWLALVTLTVLEVVLGIDNLVFISVLTSRLPPDRADRVRKIGLTFAFVFRVGLLFTLTWLIGLTKPVIEAIGISLSWRDIILIGGGLFLIAKATHEIHNEVDADDAVVTAPADVARAIWLVIGQLIVIDLVFSLDSIITAIGLVDQIEVMVAAISIAMLVMYFTSGPVGVFIREHPTTKMLALAFLLMIGVALVADGFDFHIPRGYIYTAMAFSAAVEFFNVLARRNRRRRSST